MDWADVLKTLITAVTSVIVALVTAGYFRKTQDKNKEKKSREKLVEQIQRDELIHFTLKELRRKYITDRVYIIQFHNGGTFYTQAPMQKASVTYERCSDGLEKISEKFQNILISNYNWYLTETLGNRLFYVDVDNQISDLPTKSLLRHYGNYAHAGVPIYNTDKHLVGVLCLSWVFSDFPESIVINGEFTEEFKNQLYKDANSLKPYLL
jgi:hypothetical protein